MRMRFLVVALAAMLFSVPAGAATVLAQIDLSRQQMKVYVDGAQRYVWRVSTARRGYVTPVGSYRAVRLEKSWYSRKYDNSPMPHSIFFKGGYAIHGTYSIKSLGTPASHGCVRLHPDNAATLFSLAKKAGIANTRVVVMR